MLLFFWVILKNFSFLNMRYYFIIPSAFLSLQVSNSLLSSKPHELSADFNYVSFVCMYVCLHTFYVLEANTISKPFSLQGRIREYFKNIQLNWWKEDDVYPIFDGQSYKQPQHQAKDDPSIAWAWFNFVTCQLNWQLIKVLAQL